MKINQMKKDEFFEGFYLIKTAEVRQTRAGKDYLALTFQDETGEIEGKLWDAQPGKIKDFTAGTVVHMQGRREVYNNTPQVNQLVLRLPKAGEPNDPADFKEKPPVDVKDTKDYLNQMIFLIENATWQRIVRALYGKYEKEFYSYQRPRPITMPFIQACPSIPRPWYAWRIKLVIFILSSIRACSLQESCFMT